MTDEAWTAAPHTVRSDTGSSCPTKSRDFNQTWNSSSSPDSRNPSGPRLGSRHPLLIASDILFFAPNYITSIEEQTIAVRGLEKIDLSEVKSDPSGTADQTAMWAAKFRRLLIHLDVDVLNFTDFPIAENVRRCDGLSFCALSQVLARLIPVPNWHALTITEVNPDHAPDEEDTFRRLVEMLSIALSAGTCLGRR